MSLGPGDSPWPRGIATRLALGLLLAWALVLRVWLASRDLNAGRFWDERFGVANVSALLIDGQARPANGYHPGLSYLPHALLLAGSAGLERLTGHASFAPFDGHGLLTPTGYFVCRLVSILAGVLSLYLTFRIGAVLHSDAVGLAGAVLLAGVTWHLRQSVIFKPDILLVAASLLAFLVSVSAADHPTPWRFLRAGAAIGLALACKFNAGPIAVPLTVAALGEGGWRTRRRWGALALAGGAAIAIFLSLTPFVALDPGLYVRNFGHTLGDYASKGARLGSSHLHVLQQGVRVLLSGSFFGPLIGGIGLIGFILAAWRWHGPAPAPGKAPLGDGEGRARRLGPWMAISYLASYALLYSMSTTNPSDHNWLPVAPYLALSAGWTLFAGWRWAATWFPIVQRPAVSTALLALGVIGLVVIPADRYVYEAAVPQTWEVAQDELREHLEGSRRSIVWEGFSGEASRLTPSGIACQRVGRLDEIRPAELDRSDAELFPAERLSGAAGEFYRHRMAVAGAEILHVRPSLFRAQGQALVLVIHPWLVQGEEERLDFSRTAGAGRLVGQLPGTVGAGDLVSLEVLMPLSHRRPLRRILVGQQPIPVQFAGRNAGHLVFITHRFAVPHSERQLSLVLERRFSPSSRLEVVLKHWRRGPALAGTTFAPTDDFFPPPRSK